jgi:hypothetical protein
MTVSGSPTCLHHGGPPVTVRVVLTPPSPAVTGARLPRTLTQGVLPIAPLHHFHVLQRQRQGKTLPQL